jgi:membrane-associated protease RseP (regulator of RpoE activity)
MWLNKDPFNLYNFPSGLFYSIPLLAILTAHEFGHYFAARYHKVDSTLPYYIPVPPFLLNPFGTMGAVIKIKSPIPNRSALFDIGASGPLAGFFVTMIILIYGIFTLPPIDYIYTIHPEYKTMEIIPSTGLTFGNSLFTLGMREIFSNQNSFPPMNEIYHYPFLCVGWFGLFITALNLIPIGQLDGGHILYALIGRKQSIFARIFFGTLIVIGLSSFIPLPYFSIHAGTVGWLVFALVVFFLIKLDHPPLYDHTELNRTRKYIGWITIVIFILTFLPVPFYELIPT